MSADTAQARFQVLQGAGMIPDGRWACRRFGLQIALEALANSINENWQGCCCLQIGICDKRIVWPGLYCDLTNNAAGVDALVYDMDSGATLGWVAFIERPVGTVSAAVFWCDALVRIEECGCARLQRRWFQDARAVDNNDCRACPFDGIDCFVTIDVFNMSDGIRHGLDCFHAAIMPDRGDALLCHAVEDRPYKEHKRQLVQDGCNAQFAKAVAQQGLPRWWSFDQRTKQAKFPDQMIVNDPCCWIVAANQQ